jgi:hypothetical protein
LGLIFVGVIAGKPANSCPQPYIDFLAGQSKAAISEFHARQA